MTQWNTIGITQVCNNKCVMCTNPDSRFETWDGDFDYSLEGIIGRLSKYRKYLDKQEILYLTGGEPTIHPEFVTILNYLRENFSKKPVTFFTNGRKFSSKDFAKKVLAAHDNLELEISLCGSNKVVHDGVTRIPGSFNETLHGLRNLLLLKKKSQKINIRFVVTKYTYKKISAFLKMVHQYFPMIDRITIIFWEVEGQAIDNNEMVKISYTEVAPYLEAIKKYENKFRELRLYHFPLCSLDSSLWHLTWRTMDQDEVNYEGSCKKCKYKKYCLGVPFGYQKMYGNAEFAPFLKDIVDIRESNNAFKPIDKVIKK